jgi:uncharacterized protein YjbJ (UPF0337 family)
MGLGFLRLAKALMAEMSSPIGPKLMQVYVVENFMKSSNRNRIKGAAKELKGRVKHAAGRATRNRRLQRQGRAEAAAGRARRRVGQAQQDLEAITQPY